MSTPTSQNPESPPKSGRILILVPGFAIWGVAALRCLYWLSLLADGSVGTPNPIALAILWLSGPIGLCAVGYMGYLTAKGRLSRIWQIPIVAVGGVIFLSALGD